MATEIKAPNDFRKGISTYNHVIFLGGLIDQGNSPDWQNVIVKALDPYKYVLVLNPRRESWDSSWEQSIANEPFRTQVEWELKGQEQADIKIYVFAPDEESAKNAKAPITLLELGAFKGDEVYVVCPEGYYRKGNVDIFCSWYNIPLFATLDELIESLHDRLK